MIEKFLAKFLYGVYVKRGSKAVDSVLGAHLLPLREGSQRLLPGYPEARNLQ